jgi:hypothetical protein
MEKQSMTCMHDVPNTFIDGRTVLPLRLLDDLMIPKISKLENSQQITE